ncbi:MAG: hypothetical protein HUJ78_00065 [Mogibacterium sp.]|nr:hypothetical protein [Mogibacterium sp.]
MSAIVWDQTIDRKFETGVDHGVLYKKTKDGSGNETWKGVAWNGLTSISDTPEGAEATDLYADNIVYATMRSAEKLKNTIEAYTYPKEFESCDGSMDIKEGVTIGQQKREIFALSYRTKVGSADDPTADDNYKIHIIYGMTASPSEKQYQTVNDSPEAITMSWEATTTAVAAPAELIGAKPTASVTVDTSTLESGTQNDKLKKLEGILYGSETDDARLVFPQEIYDIFVKENEETPEPEVKVPHAPEAGKPKFNKKN